MDETAWRLIVRLEAQLTGTEQRLVQVAAERDALQAQVTALTPEEPHE